MIAIAKHGMVCLRGVPVVLALAALGCGTNQAVLHYDETGGSGGSGGSGGGTSSETGVSCPGQCVEIVPLSTPVVLSLLWIGPVGQEPPPCPALAPVAVEEGYADLTATKPVCSVCACDPPQGGCDLPSAMTASNLSCGVSGGALTTFDPPAAWDGGCSTVNAIPASKLCGGGPCAKSLTIASLTLHEQGCGVSNSPAADITQPTWTTAARSCVGSAQYQGGCGLSEMCAPIPHEDGFKLCFSREGDQECPVGWTDKHTFYKGIADTRACSACSCGAPVGSTCSAQVSAYGNTGCMPSGFFASVTMTNIKDGCVDIAPGMGLLSKGATPPAYTPGVCQALGGEPSGEAVPTIPSTFCCLP
jgi:hypothetical protein